MTRGNQREIDRQRAASRHDGKGEAKAGDAFLRRESDSVALQEKIARKKAMEEAIARGEVIPEAPKKGPGGAVKKKDGSKK